MPLPSGQKLGPYEIIAPLGAGGMGEVYTARDTRLDRPVAIKVSSERFSERFQREAQAIAALNHPHICTLYDVGPDYLVMELIDGKPLEGPMPVATALRLAAQIAAGLAEAHRHGIIHRDLKPANILVTRNGVKILDFGLAKLNRPAPAPTDETLTQALTQQGAILGTPRYMSPEQLEGREADARSDIFSFGSVLYEMLSGKPAFSGKTQASLAAAILTSEPEPITAVVPGVPPAVERLLKTCLAKDPEERRQSIRDVLLELRWCAQDSAVQPGPVSAPAAPSFWRRPAAAWVVAGLAAILASSLAFRSIRSTPPAREVTRFLVRLPAGVQLGPDLPAVSPDGRSIVVSGIKSGRRDLYLRRFDEVETKLLPGTAGAGSYPFWSPDSRFVVFTSGGKLVRLEVERGSRLELGGEWRATAAGAWGPDGTIVMSDRGSLYRLPSSGGTPAPISGQGSGPGAQGYAPDFLPGGKLIYSVLDSDTARTGTYAASLGDNNPKLAIVGAMSARVAGDHLLFRQQRSILAQRISPASAAPEGEAAVVISEAGGFSVSRNGVLVHRGSGFEAKAQFAVYDADGRRGLIGPADRVLVQFEVSPDERRATVFGADETGRSVLSEMDLKSGILSAVTVEGAPGDYGAWSPDGREIALTARAGSGAVLVRKTLGDASPPKLVFSPSEAIFMEQWLTDNSLLYLNTAGRTFYRLRLEPGAKPEALLTTEYNKDEPQVAPGGRWIVYTTNESGQWEVYAATFPKFEQRRQISNGGGMQPKWRRDGRAIYYFSPTGELVVVSATPGPDAAIETGAPRVLFKTRVNPHPTRDQFAVLDGGRKFLVLEPDGPQTESIVVVVNWEALLDPKKR